MILDIQLDEDIRSWLKEDIPYWDVSFVDTEDEIVQARIVSKDHGIIAGSKVLQRIYHLLGVELIEIKEDGQRVDYGDVVARLKGKASKILQAERVSLNILGHMSGIATYTRNLVEEIKNQGLNTRIAATRKTLPGLRKYQKWAVIIGGGDTHRLDLSSMALIKENHIAAYGGVEEAIDEVRNRISFSHKIEIEVTTNEEALTAAKKYIDIIMLDNFSPDQIKAILPKIKEINDKVLIEASGGITEETILDYSRSGVDIISLGKLTHSVSNFDVSLLID